MNKLSVLVCLALCPTAIFAQKPYAKDTVDLDIMIGQMILTGIGDFSYLPKDAGILEEIRTGKVGGVILFEKNINTDNPKKQLKRTIDMLTGAADIPLFVSIDEEGGRVNRLKPKYGFPITKQARELGGMNNLDTTRAYAEKTAATLSAYGLNLNFAPNVDLAINADNPVIAKLGRSYSNDPKIVAYQAQTVIDAHRKNNVITVLKHFPGHGSSSNDSHLGVADVSGTWQFSELMPYKWLLDSGRVDGIMTAHIVNRHLDPSNLPATLSPYMINYILRGVLNYKGVVFTDDLQMNAIAKNYGVDEAIRLAINAGADVIIFVNNVPKNQRISPTQIHAIITGYVASGVINKERVIEAYGRIMRLKAKLK